MASKWESYFKIVQPATDLTSVTDNQAMDGSSYGNYSWYQRLVQGSASRIARYSEYDVMDNDVEVARALDIIAEEMTTNSNITQLPLDIDVQTEETNMMPANELLTLKAALRYWSITHDWENRLFKVARNTIKYGDCFFRRPKDPRQKWMYIHPKMVVGAMVDDNDVTKILGYQVKLENMKPQHGIGALPMAQQFDTEFVAAHDIIRFSLNDDMSHVAPFGESVLAPVYRAHKQKELIEDAIIIYRTVRAPERRVFYVDVGKMPPAMTKKYLESIKNEIRQRKIPSANGGQTNVDSIYNPASMSEDFYFAQRSDGKGTRVETLPGGQGLGELADLEYFQNKVFRGLRVPISWMNESNGGAMFNDGKVGQSYIQEVRFGKFVERLQGYIARVMDVEFKKYLKDNHIHIDESNYLLKLPEATNFENHRQAEVDAELLSTYSSAEGIPQLSKRFGMRRYLRWTEEELLENEALRMEELGISKDDPNRLQLIYGIPETVPADLSVGSAPSGSGAVPDIGGPASSPTPSSGSSKPAKDQKDESNVDTSITDTQTAQNTTTKTTPPQ